MRTRTDRDRSLIRRAHALALIGCLAVVSCSTAGDTRLRAGGDRVDQVDQVDPDDRTGPADSSAGSVAGVGGSNRASSTSATRPEPTPLQIDHATLTAPDLAPYEYLTSPDSVTVAASAALTDGSPREVFWRSDTRPRRDQQGCVTWTTTNVPGEGDPFQPGVAMRIARTGSDGQAIRAITATENVWSYGLWLFNVHLWDTSRPEPMTKIATFDASHIVGRVANVDGQLENLLAPAPWHLCARTRGDTFTLKVWTGDGREPDWDDPGHVFATDLPASWNEPGYAGGYIGHLGADRNATAVLGTFRTVD